MTNKAYTKEDCIRETYEHIDHVYRFLDSASQELLYRGLVHDLSKLEPFEVDIFTEYTPKLKTSTYGSDEYKDHLKGMKVALDHHYANNKHHPEYWTNGINDMDLFDVLEMLCDWKAAVLRHEDGDIMKSLEINRKRFGIDEQLYGILHNTIKRGTLKI